MIKSPGLFHLRDQNFLLKKMEGGKKGIQNDMEIKLTNSGYNCKLTLASPRKEPTTLSIV